MFHSVAPFVCVCFFSSSFFQSQHSHLVIQQLLGHLDANSKNSATVRAGIVEVLLEAAAIAASGSVGPLHDCMDKTPTGEFKNNIRYWAILIFHCVFRSHCVRGVQHSPEAASSECGLRVNGLLRWEHQHWHQDHQSSRGEAVAGGCHQDHW